jgi:hypothetical protein
MRQGERIAVFTLRPDLSVPDGGHEIRETFSAFGDGIGTRYKKAAVIIGPADHGFFPRLPAVRHDFVLIDQFGDMVLAQRRDKVADQAVVSLGP